MLYYNTLKANPDSAASQEAGTLKQSEIGGVERGQTMPVLANTLLLARDYRLSITGTDLAINSPRQYVI